MDTTAERYPEPADRELRLRALVPDDAGWITEACQAPDIPRWTTIPSPYSRAMATAFIAESARAWGQQAGLRLVIEHDRRPVGMVGMDRKEPGAAEIGYWVADAGRGHGAAARAARLMADWGFHGPWALSTIRLVTVVGNVASQRCCMALGARRSPTPEVVLKHAGGPWLAYTWTLTPERR